MLGKYVVASPHYYGLGQVDTTAKTSGMDILGAITTGLVNIGIAQTEGDVQAELIERQTELERIRRERAIAEGDAGFFNQKTMMMVGIPAVIGLSILLVFLMKKK